MRVNKKFMLEASLKIKDLAHTKKKNIFNLRLLDKLLRKCSIEQVTSYLLHTSDLLASHQRLTNYSSLLNNVFQWRTSGNKWGEKVWAFFQ